jgi:hypothetical protein
LGDNSLTHFNKNISRGEQHEFQDWPQGSDCVLHMDRRGADAPKGKMISDLWATLLGPEVWLGVALWAGSIAGLINVLIFLITSRR